MTFTLSPARVAELLGVAPPSFPKYTTQLLNLANQNAQGTRPAIVGQMSSLIVEAAPVSPEAWAAWYDTHHPDAIAAAADRIEAMLALLQEAFAHIDRPLIEAWVRDLVVNKTYAGFRVQDAVLGALSQRLSLPLRAATPQDEAQGIDGYLGPHPVQIKPTTYRTMKALNETLNATIVYYEKTAAGLKVEASELMQAITPG